MISTSIGTDEVAHQVLCDAEAAAGDQTGRPHRLHAPPPGLGGNQPEGDNQRKERQLSSHHRTERLQIEVGDLRQRDQRCAERPERHWRGVADQRQFGGLEWTKAQADEQCPANRHRSTKPRGPFDERAKAERDEQGLNPPIPRDPRHLPLQHRKPTRLNREVVDEDGIEHDPPDRKQTKRSAVAHRCHRQRRRHLIDKDRDPARHQQPGQCRDMRPHVPERQQAQQRDHRQGSHEGRECHSAEGFVRL
jgi:hypothetical protein